MIRRTQQIRKRILETLLCAQGYAVPEETLRSYVDDFERPPTTDDEWAADIKFLSDPPAPRMVKVPAAMDDKLIQWTITEAGHALLASL